MKRDKTERDSRAEREKGAEGSIKPSSLHHVYRCYEMMTLATGLAAYELQYEAWHLVTLASPTYIYM